MLALRQLVQSEGPALRVDDEKPVSEQVASLFVNADVRIDHNELVRAACLGGGIAR